MSTPYQREYGDWNNENFDSNCQTEYTKGDNCNKKFLEKNHGQFFNTIKELNMIEKNDALYAEAIKNIKKKPFKYLRNVLNNISRMLFNIPSSYFYQRDITLLRIIPNSILFNLTIFSLVILIKKIKKIPPEMLYAVLFIFIYLALSSLFSAYARMFTIIVPYLLIWNFYSLKIWKDS